MTGAAAISGTVQPTHLHHLRKQSWRCVPEFGCRSQELPRSGATLPHAMSVVATCYLSRRKFP